MKRIIVLAALEFRRLVATPMAALALGALLLVPVLYAGFYLWANNDPYGALPRIPVALVVQDQGSTLADKPVNYGEQVADQLLSQRQVGWVQTSAEDAQSGVRDGRYDFILQLGPEFSSALTSTDGTAPKQATIVLTTDDTNSFLATTIAGQVADRVREAVAETVGQRAAITFLDGFDQVRTSLTQAGAGASQLVAGAEQASSGAQQLAQGAASASAGADQLRGGLLDLYDSAAALPDQADELNSGAQQVAAGTEEVARIAGDLADVTGQAASDVPVVRADIVQRLTDAGFTPEEITRLLQPLDRLGAAVLDGNQRVQNANDQAQRLAEGSAELAAGTGQLAEAAPELVGGLAQASDGATALSDGNAQLAEGSSSLALGLGTLQGGLGELSNGLQQGLGQVPDLTQQERQAVANTIANPVAVDTSAVTDAATYGQGLAPFFMSLATWIGMYALFLIVKPVSERGLTMMRRPFLSTVAGWIPPALLGGVQVVAIFTVVRVLLGYDVAHPWLLLGLMFLTTFTFAAMLQALNALLGVVGQFLGLVLLVLQLASAGGTFPWQTLPGPLAFLHGVLPMGYVVDGVRQLMYGGTVELAGRDALVLVGWLVGALVVSYLASLRISRRWTMQDLSPSIYV